MSLKFANDYYTAQTFDSSPFKNSWCFSNGSTNVGSWGIDSSITSNNFTGIISRTARGNRDTVEARISDKEGNRIVTLSFTSTSS